MVAIGVSERYKALEATVQAEYPDLRLVTRDGQPVLRGSFPIRHEGEDLDRFAIEISFPEGPNALPEIREIGGRVPRDTNRHVNVASGSICAEVPELILLAGPYTLLNYLNGPVRNFFISQLCVEKGEPWPFGYWDHGKKGLIQAYGELLGVGDESAIRRYLDCLSHKKIKQHWPCPCGGGRPIRACHARQIRSLQEKVPPRIARQALERLTKAS
jgi:hypothetical protein